jgi:hypothetical protein
MTVRTLIASALCFAACACHPQTWHSQHIYASSAPISAPDGGRAWWIRCNTDMGWCYEQAGRQCPDGYERIESAGVAGAEYSSSGTAWGTGGSAFATGHGSAVGTFDGTLIIRCKTSDEVMEEAAAKDRARRAKSKTPVTSTDGEIPD